MAGLDILNITDSGLLKISQKILNSRTYSSSLITVVGDPIVLDGIASNFSSENYFIYSPLNFTDTESITIDFKGTFIEGEDKDYKQCAFELISSEGTPLTLFLENTKVTLMYRNAPVFTYNNLHLEDSYDLSIFLILKRSGFEFTLSCGSFSIQRVERVSLTIPLTSFTTLNIGSSSTNREAAWLGAINLKEFSIYNNGNLLYSPSEGTSWNFSDILVSDGKVPLLDNSTSVAEHIYQFPVTEIKRSGNTILLTSTVDAEAHLTIREIGLYIQTTDGRLLFGSINNLNINKSRDLAYNLIFTINTTINVVNAVGFPAENGIVVEDPDFMEYKDYTTLQQVNTYVLTNLERMIRMNAGAKGSYVNQYIENAQAGIGHNRPQVIYRVQQELEEAEDCYNSLDTFVKLISRFRKVTEKEMNFENLQIEGNLLIPKNGETSGFSTTDYASMNTLFTSTSSWNMDAAFTTNTNTSGTIASLSNGKDMAPLELGVADNKCYLKIAGLESINPTGLNSYYLRSVNRDKINGNSYYYGWNRKDIDNPYYNFHCNNFAINSSPMVNFPQTNNILLEHETVDSNFTFSTRVYITDVTSKQYIIGNEDVSSPEGFELFIEDGKIQANLYEDSTGELIDTLSTRFNLEVDKYYNISLSYDGEKYALYYKTEDTEEEEIEYLISSQTISLENSINLLIGSQEGSNKFTGDIDFSNLKLYDSNYLWVGASALNIVYTLIDAPDSNTPLYDNQFYLITGITAGNYNDGYIINKNNLFPIEEDTKYKLSISYSENTHLNTCTYKVIRITNDDIVTMSTIYSETFPIANDLSNRMSIPSAVYAGVSATHEISNPFSATLDLVEWEVTQEGITYPFSQEVILNNTELLQYYRVPDLNKGQYAVKDICNLGRKIKFLSDKFEGNEDIVSFAYPEGLTLCMKFALRDVEPKVLLYKSDLVEDIYFSLTFLNQTLTFTMATQDGTASISKALILQEYDSYVAEPIMLTVTYTPQYDNWGYIQMFRNNEAITESKYVCIDPTIDPTMFILSNYITGDEDFGRFLKDLVVIKGVVSMNDLKYINNLFDTNH